MNPRFLLDDLIISPRNNLNEGFNPLLIEILGLRINTPKLDKNDITMGIGDLSEYGKIILKYHYQNYNRYMIPHQNQNYNRYRIPYKMCEILNTLDTNNYNNMFILEILDDRDLFELYSMIKDIKYIKDINIFEEANKDLINNYAWIVNYINEYKKYSANINENHENDLQCNQRHNTESDIANIYYDVLSKKKEQYEYKTQPIKIIDRFNASRIHQFNDYKNIYEKCIEYKNRLDEAKQSIKSREPFEVKYFKYKKKYIELKSKLINRLKY